MTPTANKALLDFNFEELERTNKVYAFIYADKNGDIAERKKQMLAVNNEKKRIRENLKSLIKEFCINLDKEENRKIVLP